MNKWEPHSWINMEVGNKFHVKGVCWYCELFVIVTYYLQFKIFITIIYAFKKKKGIVFYFVPERERERERERGGGGGLDWKGIYI